MDQKSALLAGPAMIAAAQPSMSDEPASSVPVTVSGGAGVAQFVDEFVIAEVLGVSVKTLRNWRVNGRGPPYYKLKRGNKQGMVRYSPPECVDWMKTFRRQHSSE